ncbi:MAG: hypothetical protein AAFO83_07340 [Cyanobacteria bacterium J06607_13]
MMFQSAAPQLTQLQKATQIDQVYRVLQPEPLLTAEQLDTFYTPEINVVRGGDKMERLQLGLERAYADRLHFKACVMGHRGVGKSTEISRLLTQISDKFQPIRFSAVDVLDPGSFKPLDVLLLMMMEVAKQTAKPISEGGANHRPSDRRLQEIWDWFATEKETRELAQAASTKLAGGIGAGTDSLWQKVLGLFATLKGEMKFASARKKEVISYRITRLDTLIELANRLLDECNLLLRETTGKQWLIVGEDFDRAGIPSAQIEDLFITYANIFQELRSHLIFTLPISLYYSAKAARLPFSSHQSFVIPDTPMFDAEHLPNERGQGAVERALAVRMDLGLFEPTCLPRLIVASGGNLRNLFSLVNYAADGAAIRGAALINEADADAAIVNLRSDYERRLGQSPYDAQNVGYEDKAALLVRIYHGEKGAQMTNPALYSLLNARAVQEFNGQRWFGIHPLVVDILVAQKHLSEDALGGTF